MCFLAPRLTDEGYRRMESRPVDAVPKCTVRFPSTRLSFTYVCLGGECAAGVAALIHDAHVVHINGGSFNVANVQNQQNPAGEIHIPFALHQIANFRDVQIATLGKASPNTGEWIYVWREFCLWMNPEGYIRIIWGSGMRESTSQFLVPLNCSNVVLWM